ncbi:MAG: hypothetical protein ACREQZ_00800 [Woeseiaceae bacterium]
MSTETRYSIRMHDSLLQPSLNRQQPVSIFSPSALFATAFFGGALGVTVMAAMNSVRLRRVQRDLPILVLGPLSAVAVVFSAHHYYPGADARDLRLAVRAAGLLCWLGFYAMHRMEYKAMNSMGLAPRRPWVAALISIAMGMLGSVLLGQFLTTYPERG